MIQVYPLPPQLLHNPYLDQLYGAMHDPTVEVRRVRPRYAIPALLRGRGPRIMHLHFFDELTQQRSRMQTIARSLGVIALVRLLQARGVRVVWTAHNLQPHERYYPIWAFRVYRWIARHSDAIIAHSVAARAQLDAYYGPTARCVVIPHGNYIGLYGTQRDQAQSRAELGLPTRGRVLLSLGTLRPYKGLEDLLAAFAQLPIAERGTLLIAGAVKDPQYAVALRQQARSIAGVALREGFLADNDVPTYLAAADAVVMPYRTLLTSGILLWAFSYRRPVIAPAFGPVRELVQDGRGGFVFAPGDQAALMAALERALTHPDLTALGTRAFEVAQRFDWSTIAQQTLAVYHQVAGH